MGRRIRLGITGLAIALGSQVAAAQLSHSGQLRLAPADIAAMPETSAGAGTSGLAHIRMTVLQGDPSTAGPYTIALDIPPNSRIEAHTHRDQRSAVVVRGTWYFGYGAKAADVAFKKLEAGSFYTEPANMPHFAKTGPDGATVYITGRGPSDTIYIRQ